MQQYFRSTPIQICQIKGFTLATPSGKKKSPTDELNETSEAIRNVLEIKEIVWPAWKMERSEACKTKGVKQCVHRCSYLDVSKANILIAAQASLNLHSWDLRTLFMTVCWYCTHRICVNDSSQDEIHDWRSENATCISGTETLAIRS